MMLVQHLWSKQIHQSPVWNLAWKSCNNNKDMGKFGWFVSVGQDKVIRIWQTDGTVIYELKEGHSKSIRCVDISPNGHLLAACSFDSTVSIWTLSRDESSKAKIKCITSLEGHENEIKGVAFSPSGRILATCGRDRTIWLWKIIYGNEEDYRLCDNNEDETPEFECLAILNDHSQDVKALTWNPCLASEFTSVSYDETARIWTQLDLEDDGEWGVKQVIELPTLGTVWCAVYAPPMGDFLFLGGHTGTLAIYERMRQMYYPMQIVEVAHQGAIYSLDCICNVNFDFDEDTEDWTQLAASPETKTILATASQDRTIKIWSLDRLAKTIRLERTLEIVPVKEDSVSVEINTVRLKWLSRSRFELIAGDDLGQVALYEISI